MKKKKIKKASFNVGIEPWKNKRQQKEVIDKKNNQEAFEKLMREWGNDYDR